MILLPHLLLAHAFGARYELPIPLWLFVFAGAGVVLLSFFLVLSREVAPGGSVAGLDRVPMRRVGLWPAIISLIGLAGAVTAGLVGSQVLAENILPTLFWVVVWVGVALSCGVLGDWTRPINPFANVAMWSDNSRLRRMLLARPDALLWPEGLGWWPATGCFALIVAGELIFNAELTVPANLAMALLAYAVVSAAMGLIFGGAWLQRGEVFSVMFNTWGRLGFWRFGAPGRRGFLRGLDLPFAPRLSRVVFVVMLLASVSFDGLLSTPLWSSFKLGLPPALASGAGYDVIALAAFAGVTALLLALFGGFALAVRRAGRLRGTVVSVLSGLLPSLLPISYGYLLAHYLQYLLINAQLMFPLIGNPAGLENWPVHLPYPFNDSYEPNVHILSTAAAWYIAVAVIVLVHIVAVVLAHRHLARSASRNSVRRSEYPWIAAMVVYTMLSLWLLAQPLIKEDGGTGRAPTVTQIAVR